MSDKISIFFALVIVISFTSCGSFISIKRSDSNNTYEEITYQEPCPDLYQPVCGNDCITYDSPCEAEQNGVYYYTYGICSCTDPIPIGKTEYPDPINNTSISENQETEDKPDNSTNTKPVKTASKNQKSKEF